MSVALGTAVDFSVFLPLRSIPNIHPSHDAGSLAGICVASNKDVRLKSLAREQGTDKLAIYTWTVTFT